MSDIPKDTRIDMTPETLRAFGDEMLANGEFYADDAATVDEYASIWEADQLDRDIRQRQVQMFSEALDAAGSPSEMSPGVAVSPADRVRFLAARIEALEKALVKVREYVEVDGGIDLQVKIGKTVGAALAASELHPLVGEENGENMR